MVIGNWLKPPDDLHLGELFADEVVCLVGKDHPAVRRGWDAHELAGSPSTSRPRRPTRARAA